MKVKYVAKMNHSTGATSVILSRQQHGIRATADIAPLIHSYKHNIVFVMMQ
jgi:hypothetical protein